MHRKAQPPRTSLIMVSRTNNLQFAIYIIVITMMTTTLLVDATADDQQQTTSMNFQNTTTASTTPKPHHTGIRNMLLSSNNELWDALIKDCLTRPTMSCFQKNVHSYLDTALTIKDVNVTDGFKFLQNKVDLLRSSGKEAEIENDIPYDDDVDDDADDTGRSGMFVFYHNAACKNRKPISVYIKMICAD